MEDIAVPLGVAVLGFVLILGGVAIMVATKVVRQLVRRGEVVDAPGADDGEGAMVSPAFEQVPASCKTPDGRWAC